MTVTTSSLGQQSAINAVTTDVSEHQTLLGVSDGSTTLGAFTGTTIADNRNVKAALQDLETALEGVESGSIGEANLGYTAGATNGVVTSSAGTDATLPAGSTSNASLMLPADKTKVDYLTVTAPTDLDDIRVKSGRFVDAETDLGIVPNSSAAASANTTALRAYFTANGTTRQPPLQFGVGDFHFSGVLHDGNDAGYRAFNVCGVMGPEFAAQHIETGPTIQTHSRIILRDLTRTQAWLKIDGSGTDATRPNGIRIENLVFEIPEGHTGSVLDFGTYSTATSSDVAMMRHVSIQGCYFTAREHVANDWGGTKPNQAWLRSTADGFVLQRSQQDYLVRMSRVYDLDLKAGFRGGNGPQIWLINCDAPIVQSRHILAWQAIRVGALDATEWHASDGVPGRYDVYCETPLISGVFASSGSFQGRIESGYSNEVKEDVQVLNTGPYAMPTGTTWSVGINSNYIQFANLPSGRDVTDYFEPGTIVRLTPVAGGEFEVSGISSTTVFTITGGSAVDDVYIGRHLTQANGTTFTSTNTQQGVTVTDYVGSTGTLTVSPAISSVSSTDKVRIATDHPYSFIVVAVDGDTDRVYFANSDGVCKTNKRYLYGTAANCERIFGCPMVLAGERLNVGAMSFDINENYPKLPKLAISPRKTPISVAGIYGGVGTTTQNLDETQQYLLVGHCTPQNFGQSRVLFQGHWGWNHPFVKNLGNSQPYDPNVSEYVRYRPENVFPFVWRPGMVTNDNAANQNLSYHLITDGDEDVWTAFVGDAIWVLPMINPVQCVFTVRLWSPQDMTSTFRASLQDQTSAYPVSVVAGWNTITFSPTETAPTEYKLSQRELYIAWVGATPV